MHMQRQRERDIYIYTYAVPRTHHTTGGDSTTPHTPTTPHKRRGDSNTPPTPQGGRRVGTLDRICLFINI